jgi:hypothetical protein
VVVDYGDVKRIAVLPAEADSPLIVDANAVLASAISFQLLQPVAWWNTKIFELFGGVDLHELAQHETL